MSVRSQLDGHLTDLMSLTTQLVQQISGQTQQSVATTSNSAASALTPAGSIASIASGANSNSAASSTSIQHSGSLGGAAVSVGAVSVQRSISMLLAKDRLLQAAVDKLISQQRFQRRLAQLADAVSRADQHIVDFATRLGRREQTLHDAVHRHSAPESTLGSVTPQPFSVDEVSTFAERLATMSFAPADYIERKGLAAHKPPAPLESSMSASFLNLSIDELLALKDARSAASIATVDPSRASNANTNDTNKTNITSSSSLPSSNGANNNIDGPTSNGNVTATATAPVHDDQPTAIDSSDDGDATSRVVNPAPPVPATVTTALTSTPTSVASASGVGGVTALRVVKPPTGWKPGDPITPQLFAAFMSRASAKSSSSSSH